MSGENAAQITGQAWTIRQLFNGRRYVLDSYQRDYAWGEPHLGDLINDLTGCFRPSWSPDHEKQDVAGYEPYFLGSIVTYRHNDRTILVDGQQRLTTLMLLLMWLNRLQGDRADAVEGVLPLVRSDHYGTRTFAVEDPLEERRPYLARLLAGETVDLNEDGISKSARNIVERFENISGLFPEDLCDDELPYFIYWLLDRVVLVEISTHNEASALGTFETMNDRGLRLAPLDLLKSFILGKVNPASRAHVDQIWRARLAELSDADNNSPATFVKNWLRAKYSRGAADDEAIGGTFHKWLRTEHAQVGLQFPGQFHELVVNDMHQLAKRNVKLIEAAKKPTAGLEPLYYNELNSVTLQFPLILAAVRPNDDHDTFMRKTRLVAGFLDVYVARCMVNFRDYRQDALAKSMMSLARELRDKDFDAIAKRLGEALSVLPETFDGVTSLGLRPGNRPRVKYLLARLTAWVQTHGAAGADKNEAEAVRTFRQQEIEHVWADNASYHPEVQPRRFPTVRNRFGALVLLPKPVNASLGAFRFVDKVPKYPQHNLLAGSLSTSCYVNNPTFQQLIATHQLGFEGYVDDFDEAAIGARQKLYQRLCELVWDPTQYGLVLPTARPVGPKIGARVHFGISVARLVEKNYIAAESELIGSYQNVDHSARLTPEGRIRVVDSGETFDTPSAAAAAVLERPSWNGWAFWRVVASGNTTVTLDAIRRRALKDGIRAED